MKRQALLRSFQDGVSRIKTELVMIDQFGKEKWISIQLQLLRNGESDDVILFALFENVDGQRAKELNDLATMQYDDLMQEAIVMMDSAKAELKAQQAA